MEEEEAFNEIERRSKVKQEILNNPSKEAKLIAEVTMLTEAVRILSQKVDQLEKKQ
jgi:NAD-dependent SIR2 family protein deacetylase